MSRVEPERKMSAISIKIISKSLTLINCHIIVPNET